MKPQGHRDALLSLQPSWTKDTQMTFKRNLAVLSLAALVAGCQSTGEEYESNVFDASQVNTQQEAKTVNILSISPTKIKVSNEANKKAATVIGGLLGAVAGGVLGNTRNKDTAVIGAVGGGVVGALGGSLVNDTTLVPGILIGYSENGKIYTSAQVGKACEFQLGGVALMVKTLSNETRIQPNASCPEPTNKG
jgi:outer membrane lipoprotein SlyB